MRLLMVLAPGLMMATGAAAQSRLDDILARGTLLAGPTADYQGARTSGSTKHHCIRRESFRPPINLAIFDALAGGRGR